MNEYCSSKYQSTLNLFYQILNVVSKKDLVLNTVFCQCQKKTFGALSTDLSKAFHYLLDDLLLAKLNADGFKLPVLRLIKSYLSN